MAVTNQKSTQLAREESYSLGRNPPTDARGVVHVLAFSFTQSGAGDATSTARLCKLPAGTVRVLDIAIKTGALGASRVMDLGYEGHADGAGAAVSADADAFANDVDVSAAATSLVHVNTVFSSRDGVVIAATIAGGTIPDATNISGYVRYVGG